ncbi:MAG: ATP-binding protein [Gammaproteobacteria bacterium]|nr:ATP-binding protein [Gammaproteobacteria bacterium]MDE0612442.1 ATP-binding protein [Gammaproteobacteria bacterium]
MERFAYQELLEWKNQAERKPILIDGARQTGKTYLVEKLFGPREFGRVHKFDFRTDPKFVQIFKAGLSPVQIISNAQVLLKRPIDLDHDLLFFDEVGDCQPAVDSLKYFAEQSPQSYVCATGSNTGLLGSFPVGKVEFLELFPLCFEEFLMALGEDILLNAFRERQGGAVVHDHLWNLLCDYYFVGGMPEAVQAWSGEQQDIHTRIQRIKSIHATIIDGFYRDFGKYSGLVDAMHIESVFRNIPEQLSRSVDGSVRRYRFGGVIPKKKRYADLRGPIDWLLKTRLAWKSRLIRSRPAIPLPPLCRGNDFKLYFFDVGILCHLLGMEYADHQDRTLQYKGFIAENFFLTEYRSHIANMGQPVYSWTQKDAEIEFLHRDKSGAIVPIEVKSGRRTRARSLESYITRYQPEHAVKFANVDTATRSGIVSTWPLYDVQFLRDL